MTDDTPGWSVFRLVVIIIGISRHCSNLHGGSCLTQLHCNTIAQEQWNLYGFQMMELHHDSGVWDLIIFGIQDAWWQMKSDHDEEETWGNINPQISRCYWNGYSFQSWLPVSASTLASAPYPLNRWKAFTIDAKVKQFTKFSPIKGWHLR